jgi:Family of unknown function (DUF6220)
MRRILRQVHAAAAWLFVASIVVQVFLAGAAIANLGGSGDFTTHIGFGYSVVGLAALAVLVTAAVARAGRRDVGTSFGLLVLYVIQTALPQLRASAPYIAALHPLNAMILFALATWYARRAWRLTLVGSASAASDAAGGAAPAAIDPT